MTVLEVIDTAVKIGLGAFIAGAASFALNRQKHLHDQKVKSSDEARQLLREIALKLESVESHYNDAVVHYHVKLNDEGMRSIAKSVGDAYAVCALSNLAGMPEVVEIGEEIVILVENIFRELTNDPVDDEKVDDLSDKLSELKKRTYPLIQNEFKRHVA